MDKGNKQSYTIRAKNERFVLEHRSADGLSEGRVIVESLAQAKAILRAWKKID